MLTHFRDWYQPDKFLNSLVPSCKRKLSGLLVAVCLTAPLSIFAQSGPNDLRPNHFLPAPPPQVPFQVTLPQESFPQGQIQQAQNTPQSARAIHHLIEDMPQSQDEPEAIQRRS